MPLWINLFLGVSSYSYSGVLYRYGGESYTLSGNESWGRGAFYPVGVHIAVRRGWILVLDYRRGEVARVWRTGQGIYADTGNSMWTVDVALGRRWRFPMNRWFISHVSLSLAFRVSGFYDPPDFVGDEAERMRGYGAVVKGLGGIYYRFYKGLGIGGNLLIEFSPFTFYRGRDYLWSPLMGQTLGGTVSVVWDGSLP